MLSPEVQHERQCAPLCIQHSGCKADKAGACLGVADCRLAGGQCKGPVGSCKAGDSNVRASVRSSV